MYSIRKQNTYIIILLVLCMIFLSCKKNKKSASRRESAISVLVASPIKQSLDEYLNLSAEIKATREVEVSADVSGRVANILRYEGSFVGRGETIALIDRFVIGANYSYAPARSSIAGYVTKTYVPVGASVSASTPIANVADIRELEVEIQVPERSVADIKLGQKVYVNIPSSDKVIEAIITKKDFAINPQTRTLTVKALIDNREQILLPGMFSDTSILLNSATNNIIVPNSAIFMDDLGRSYIYVVEDKVPNNKVDGVDVNASKEYRVYQREIDVLFTYKDKVAIRSGIEEGEEVVMFGREFLKDGSLINRIENDPFILEFVTPQTNNVEDNIINLGKTSSSAKSNEGSKSSAKNTTSSSSVKQENKSIEKSTTIQTTNTTQSTNNTTTEDTDLYTVGGGN